MFLRVLFAACVILFSSVPAAEESAWWVQFKLSSGQAVSGRSEWLASYSEEGKEAKFLITVDSDFKPSKEGFTFANGRIQRVPGSQPTLFLRKLSHALGAGGKVPASKPVGSLPVQLAILGTAQSRISREGGFSSSPRGDWIATKLFLGNGAAEVYLNLNPRQGIGEFSIKDEEYAERVLRELASVL